MTPEEAIENLNKVVVWSGYHTGYKDIVCVMRGYYVFKKEDALYGGLHHCAVLEERKNPNVRMQVALEEVKPAGADIYTTLCMEGTV